MDKDTDKQGNTGYGSPPKECQFEPGQSGNPAGPPKARTQLWRYFCKYMDLTDKGLAKMKAKRLTQSQQAAVKLVEDMKAGNLPKSGKFAQYVVDRELGKPKEHVQLDTSSALSDAECESVRDILRQNGNHS